MDSSDKRRSLDIIAHACPVPVIALDGGGNVRIWNATAERLLGWKESEVIAKPLPTVPAGGGLPVEVEPDELVVVVQEEGPGAGERPRPHPFLEAIMHGGLGSERAGHGPPLGTGAQHPDHAIEQGAVVRAGPTWFFAGLDHYQQGREARPQCVIRTPNGWVIFGRSSGHRVRRKGCHG